MSAIPLNSITTQSHPTRPPSRQARLLVASFNGTWAGGVLSSRKTVVSEFVKLISEHENVFEIPVNGVGSDLSLVDWIGGGVGGWGTLRNVITAFRNISRHYVAGDRIILSGYSRGAWAARYLAMLIDMVGLPKDGDEALFHRLYKACDTGSILDESFGAKLMEGYDCWQDVKINALCCFDTVGSFGFPLTGVAKPLAYLAYWKKKKSDIVSDVASNVEFAFHCISLHETREPYTPTLMRGPNVRQVCFPGRHGNLGWIEESEGLVHAPFAWMIQQIVTHLHISFDETRLAARFPSYRAFNATTSSPSSSTTATATSSSSLTNSTSSLPLEPPWVHGRIQHVSATLLALIGKKSRKLGRTTSISGATDIKIHIGARLRNALDGANTVPGYVLMAPATGKPFWARPVQTSMWTWGKGSEESLSNGASQGRNKKKSTSWPRMAERIEEDEVGMLEARLLGLPLSIARA